MDPGPGTRGRGPGPGDTRDAPARALPGTAPTSATPHLTRQGLECKLVSPAVAGEAGVRGGSGGPG
jgi:hypothetical protein